jgi:hypothetical protein
MPSALIEGPNNANERIGLDRLGDDVSDTMPRNRPHLIPPSLCSRDMFSLPGHARITLGG